MRVHVVTHHLEMTDPAQLRPAQPSRDAYAWQAVARPDPELAHFLYRSVGGEWYWLNRLSWSRAQWTAHVARSALSLWVGAVGGAPAGYAEMETQAGGAVEILYFGVRPAWIGRGLGGALLTEAVRSAWGLGARRVWLHTCTLDHPAALAHYQARGFRVFKVEEGDEDVPERSPGYWGGES
ncbi:MAG: GNAT family N-acetyltransferase [Candidatus Binatia bacterium]